MYDLLAYSLPCKQSPASKSSAYSGDSAGKAVVTECKPGRCTGRMLEAARSAPNMDTPPVTAPVLPLPALNSSAQRVSSSTVPVPEHSETHAHGQEQSVDFVSWALNDSNLIELVRPGVNCWKVTLLDFGNGAVEWTALYLAMGALYSDNSGAIRGKKEYACNAETADFYRWCDDSPERKALDYLDGRNEIPWGSIEAWKETKERERLEARKKNQERSKQRAKSSLRRRIMLLKMDRMLTLTSRADLTYEEAREVFRKFTRLMGKEFGKDWDYVCIPEEHKSLNRAKGSYHLHLAINHFYPVERVRYLWHRALGWKGKEIARGSDSPGNVDITSPRKGIWERHKIAKYLSKYMAKNLEMGLGAKSYWASKTKLTPKKVVFYIRADRPIFDGKEGALKILIEAIVQEVTKLKPKRFWTCDDRALLWGATY